MTTPLAQNEIDFINKYDGRALTEDELSTYEKWAMSFFHQKEFVTDPMINITIQLDITAAYASYAAAYTTNNDASFTAYLMWHIVNSTKKHPFFRYRKVKEQWYVFDNLPLYAPVAVGGDIRFREMELEPPTRYAIDDFFAYYRQTLTDLKNDASKELRILDPFTWSNSWFVGNLPNMQFTGFQLHKGAENTGRPYFYFGKRYEQGGQKFIPLLIAFDHSNLDPFVISNFMKDFQANIDGNILD